MPNVTQIAGGLLTPGEKASWQLRRLVHSFDSNATVDIIYNYVGLKMI